MAGSSVDPGRAALCSWSDAPVVRALVHCDFAHYQVVEVDPRRVALVLLLGVGDRRTQELRQRSRKTLGRKIEDLERLVYTLAANLVGEQARLPPPQPAKSAAKSQRTMSSQDFLMD